MDENGIYVSVVCLKSGLRGNRISAVQKPDIYQGQLEATNWFVSTNELETWTIQPALNWDTSPNGDTAWFVGKGRPQHGSPYRGGNLFYRGLEWKSGATKFEWATTNWVGLPTSSDHLKYYDFDSGREEEINFYPPQKGTTTDFGLAAQANIGSRLMMAFIQEDPSSSKEQLWTCHHIGFAGTNYLYGGDEFGANVDRSGVQWVKVDIDSNGDLLSSNLDFGRILDPNDTTTPYWYYFPSLAVNVNGTAVFGFSGSEASEYIGAFYTGRLENGTMPPRPTLVEAGRDLYGTTRWGDYSATSLALSGTNIWTVQEHVDYERGTLTTANDRNWSTWIAEIKPNN